MKNYSIKTIVLAAAIISIASFLFSCQDKNGSNSGALEASNDQKVQDSASYWKTKLTPNAYYIMVEKGTERAFTNEYHNNHRKGIYVSAATGKPLFSSEDKFDSGTGWPSFTKPINEETVKWLNDASYGMSRDEVIEKETGLHLGHVFNDGPKPSGLRYCINSGALKFIAAQE